MRSSFTGKDILCFGILSSIVTTMVTEAYVQEIQLREAKATLSAVVDQARAGQPSVITRHGRPEAVVVSFEEWQRLSQMPSFGRLLMAAPLEDDDLPSRQGGLRDTGL
jgi:antitoxin Phd